MDRVEIARALFGTTMGFHIIFATVGVGLPLMVFCAELLYQLTKNKDYSVMAYRWTKGFAIILGASIPTGTIAGVQLSLLWPGFMRVVGKVIALPFQIEIYAFFLEALFMSIYIYAAERLSPIMRLVSVALVTIGAAASAILITNVHAFEGTPAGFDIVNGKIMNVDPWKAFFNPSFAVTAWHVTVSAFMTGAFIIATIASLKMIKYKKHNEREYHFHQKALILSLTIGGLFSIMTALNGHESAQQLHQYQPEKLAAAEGLFKTQTFAPLSIGGIPDPKTQQVKGGIEIPWALSFLAGNRFDEKVQGLDDFPKQYWPPLFVHTLFNAMVFIGFFLLFLSIVGFVWNKILKKKAFPKWILWIFAAAGPLSMLSIEFGWIFSCTGRQPWVIYHVMLTKDAATGASNLGVIFALFLFVYLILAISTVFILKHYFNHHPLASDLPEEFN